MTEIPSEPLAAAHALADRVVANLRAGLDEAGRAPAGVALLAYLRLAEIDREGFGHRGPGRRTNGMAAMAFHRALQDDAVRAQGQDPTDAGCMANFRRWVEGLQDAWLRGERGQVHADLAGAHPGATVALYDRLRILDGVAPHYTPGAAPRAPEFIQEMLEPADPATPVP